MASKVAPIDGVRRTYLQANANNVVIIRPFDRNGERSSCIRIVPSPSISLEFSVRSVDRRTILGERAWCTAVASMGPNLPGPLLFQNLLVTESGLVVPFGREVPEHGIRLMGDNTISSHHGFIHVLESGIVTIADNSLNGTEVSVLHDHQADEMIVMTPAEIPQDIKMVMTRTAQMMIHSDIGM